MSSDHQRSRLAWCQGASIPPEPMKHSPVSENHVRKRLVYEKTFLTHFPEDIFLFRPIRQNVWSPFIVIVHYFHIFRFPGCKFPIIPSYFPLILKFPLFQIPPIFHMFLHLIFVLIEFFYISFPFKLTKTFVSHKIKKCSPLKWEWWRFLLHFPMPIGWTPLVMSSDLCKEVT